MKKRIIGIFLAVAMLVPTVFTVSASAYSQSKLPQALLLYTGFTTNNGSAKYPTYKDGDLETLWNMTHEFIICSGNTRYNSFDLDKGMQEIVSQEDIDRITSKDIDAGQSVSSIQKQLDGIYSGLKGGYGKVTLDSLAENVALLVDRLITASDESSDLAIWLPLPTVDFKTLADNFETPYKLYMDKLEELIGPADFDDYVRGFYWGTEAIVTGYTPFNVNSPSSNFGNQLVDLMDSIGTKVRSMGKQFLWCPYMAPTDDGNFLRTGNVINRLDIFDYACIQPGYYFNSSAVNNLYSVRDSAQDNVVYDYNGRAYGTKTSDTVIGVTMEIDDGVINAAENNRYWAYTQVFTPIKDSVPIAFYASDATNTMNKTVQNYLKAFFNS